MTDVEREVDLHWANLKTATVSRLPLAQGLVGRAGLSKTLAIYSNIHPTGDFANFVNIDPTSAAFQKTVARVPLAKLLGGPVAGKDAAGTERRHSGITPDGRWAFVTQGGEGLINVIDTQSNTLVRQIKTPTTLKGGGYVFGAQPGAPLLETEAR